MVNGKELPKDAEEFDQRWYGGGTLGRQIESFPKAKT